MSPGNSAPPPPSVCAPRGWADSKGRCGAGPQMTRGWRLLPSAQALTPPGRRASAGGAGLQQLVPRHAVRSCFVGSVTPCEGGPGSPRLHRRARQLSRDAAVDAEWGRGPDEGRAAGSCQWGEVRALPAFRSLCLRESRDTLVACPPRWWPVPPPPRVRMERHVGRWSPATSFSSLATCVVWCF